MSDVAELGRPVYTVRAVQEGNWWVASVPELNDVTTQARRHYEIRDLARGMIAGLLDVHIATIVVNVTPARILVTGSRWWADVQAITSVLLCYRELLPGAVLVHGNCRRRENRGADIIAAGIWQGWGLPTEAHTAAWASLGSSAGPKRNTTMVGYGAQVCLAFPMADSRGTLDCMAKAERAGIPVITFADCTR